MHIRRSHLDSDEICLPGFLAASSLSLLSVLLTMATLKPSLAHLRTHDIPVPGPTPNTTHTFPAISVVQSRR